MEYRNEIPILSSGFLLGISNQPVSYPETVKTININNVIKNITEIKYGYIAPVKEIDELFHATNKDLNKDFDFIEKVIKIFFNIYTPQTFANWILMQDQSPFYTAAHRQFINDTITYLETGKRKLEVPVWKKVVVRRETNINDKLEEILLPRVSNGAYSNLYNTTYTIKNWLTYKDGLSDLIGFLDLVFGNSN